MSKYTACSHVIDIFERQSVPERGGGEVSVPLTGILCQREAVSARERWWRGGSARERWWRRLPNACGRGHAQTEPRETKYHKTKRPEPRLELHVTLLRFAAAKPPRPFFRRVHAQARVHPSVHRQPFPRFLELRRVRRPPAAGARGHRRRGRVHRRRGAVAGSRGEGAPCHVVVHIHRYQLPKHCQRQHVDALKPAHPSL